MRPFWSALQESSDQGKESWGVPAPLTHHSQGRSTSEGPLKAQLSGPREQETALLSPPEAYIPILPGVRAFHKCPYHYGFLAPRAIWATLRLSLGPLARASVICSVPTFAEASGTELWLGTYSISFPSLCYPGVPSAHPAFNPAFLAKFFARTACGCVDCLQRNLTSLFSTTHPLQWH